MSNVLVIPRIKNVHAYLRVCVVKKVPKVARVKKVKVMQDRKVKLDLQVYLVCQELLMPKMPRFAFPVRRVLLDKRL